MIMLCSPVFLYWTGSPLLLLTVIALQLQCSALEHFVLLYKTCSLEQWPLLYDMISSTDLLQLQGPADWDCWYLLVDVLKVMSVPGGWWETNLFEDSIPIQWLILPGSPVALASKRQEGAPAWVSWASDPGSGCLALYQLPKIIENPACVDGNSAEAFTKPVLTLSCPCGLKHTRALLEELGL